MAPKNPRTQTTEQTQDTPGSSSTPTMIQNEELSAARAEIEQLRAQLLAQQDEELLARQQLEQAFTDRPKRSGKLPDLPLLTDNKEPTYKN